MVSRHSSLGPDPEMTIGDVDGFLEEGEGGDFAPSLSNNAATWPRVFQSILTFIALPFQCFIQAILFFSENTPTLQ